MTEWFKSQFRQSVLSENISGIPHAAALAKAADVTVLVLGTDIGVACENRDAGVASVFELAPLLIHR